MATTLTISRVPRAFNRAWVASWNLSNGEAGDPFEQPGSSDRSAQVGGTFGVGGSVSIEGSNDGVNYRVLTDPQGNALTFTSANLEAVSEVTRFIRGRVTAGDGTTAITVHLLATGNHLG